MRSWNWGLSQELYLEKELSRNYVARASLPLFVPCTTEEAVFVSDARSSHGWRYGDLHTWKKNHVAGHGARRHARWKKTAVAKFFRGSLNLGILSRWLFTIFPKVDIFTYRWTRAIFVLTFSPSGENVNTNTALIHRQVKKRNIPFYIKNDMGPNDSLTDGRKSYDCDEKYHIQK